MSRRFYIATFGCRTNQADSAAIRQDFLDAGYREVEKSSEADAIVVNSCTVTHRSDQQVRQLSRKLRRENPQARLMVTGCYAQREPEALSRIEGIDAVVGNTHKSDLIQIAGAVPAVESEASSPIYRDDFTKIREIDSSSANQVGGRTRPFVKIQDGCDAKCTYCIIPSVRGPSRSVPPQQVLAQVRDLVAAGFQEVVLTGIHIGTYGMHLHPRMGLDRLISRIVEVPGLQRLRISSIEPMELSKRVIELAARSPRIAPHLHICLQSGCDRVLKRMLRPYNSTRFAGIVELIRSSLPDASIGTDVIVGFPGETEADHQESLEFVSGMPFTYLHVFPYSDRPGTTASSSQDKVEAGVKKDRCREFLALSQKKERDFRRGFIGRSLSVLSLTDTSGPHRLGLSGNYLKAKLHGDVPPNRIVEGRVSGEEGEYLLMESVSPAEAGSSVPTSDDSGSP